jgi:DNA-binding response OmpR family regulator
VRILILEDEPKVARLLERGLGEEGHRVTVAGELEEARRLLHDTRFDLWVVDRMLPDGDGLSLVRERRRAGDRTPALCLTARDRVAERVEGLNGGADDYLVKPFVFDELLARITALARRAGGGERLVVGPLELDPAAHRAWRDGQELALTAQEFRLLRYLVENAGRVLSRVRLLEHVWDTHHDPGTNVVDVYIGYLRSKVDKPFGRPLIHTIRGVGYVLEDSERPGG